MEKSTISIIRRYIKENKKLSNIELAKLINKKSNLSLSVASLQKYIARVKALNPKTIETKSGNVTGKKVEVKQKVTKTNIMSVNKSQDKKSMTIQEHIQGYLLAFTDKSFSEICSMMKQNNLGTQYTDGTLRNYISAEAKKLKEVSTKTSTTSSEKLIKEVKKIEEKEEKIKNHEVIIIDEASYLIGDIQYILDNASTNSDNEFTVVSFSENITVHAVKEKTTKINIKPQYELGSHLLSAISTTLQLLSTHKDTSNFNLTIISHRPDSLSNYLTYEDVAYSLNYLINKHNWNINFIYTNSNEQMSKKLAFKLGIDTSNSFNTPTSDFIIESMHKRIKSLIDKKEELPLNYFK